MTLEWFHAATTNYQPGTMATATAPATLPQEPTLHGNQPSFTVAYMF
jgi:hypothetical protein